MTPWEYAAYVVATREAEDAMRNLRHVADGFRTLGETEGEALRIAVLVFPEYARVARRRFADLIGEGEVA